MGVFASLKNGLWGKSLIERAGPNAFDDPLMIEATRTIGRLMLRVELLEEEICTEHQAAVDASQRADDCQFAYEQAAKERDELKNRLGAALREINLFMYPEVE